MKFPAPSVNIEEVRRNTNKAEEEEEMAEGHELAAQPLGGGHRDT